MRSKGHVSVYAVVVSLFFWALAACAPVDRTTAGPPPPDGTAIVDYLADVDPYQNWALWPGKGRLYAGQHPHGAFLTTYVSSNAVTAITSRSSKLPARSMIVKENYSPAKELVAVTVMYRVPGYNPDAGDWFWLKYEPNGVIEAEGRVAGCIECHSSVRSNDWLFTGPVR